MPTTSHHYMNNTHQLYISSPPNLYHIHSRHPTPLLNLQRVERQNHTSHTSDANSNSQDTSLHDHTSEYTFESMVVIPAPRDLYEREVQRERREQEKIRQMEQGSHSLGNGLHSDSNADSTNPESDDPSQSLLGVYPLVACVARDKVCILSLHSLTWMHEISFQENVEEVQANRDLLMVRTKKHLYWYPHLGTQSIVKFELYPDVNCFSLSERWIAYSSNLPIRSRDMDLSDYQKTLTKISQNLAQFTTSGFKYVSDSFIHHLASARESSGLSVGSGMGSATSTPPTSTTATQHDSSSSSSNSTPERSRTQSTRTNTNSPQQINYQILPHSGTIEIRDVRSKKTIAHFRGHKNPVCAMQFDDSGTLLVTASTRGTDLNVYRIAPSMSGKVSHKNVIHIYTLERGITSARITSISFSNNSKWVAVGSNHGTTHVFAINPHGGNVNTKTHCELVTSQMNDAARLEYQKQTKHIYCAPISRIRTEDIARGAPSEDVCVAFYSPSGGGGTGDVRGSPREQLYIICSNGTVGLFTLIPRQEQQSAGDEADDTLAVDVQRLDTWRLEQPVRANYSVTWEDDEAQRLVAQQQRQEETMRMHRELMMHKQHTLDDDPLTGSMPASLHSPPLQDSAFEDDEGEWISNLEIETYNPQERVWVSGQIRFVQLMHPIERANITDPNLEGEAINVKMVQMNTPTKPIDWDQYKLKFKPNTIVTAVDSSPLHRTPKLTDLDSSLKPLKQPPSRGRFYENRSRENVEDYFPVMEQSMMVESLTGLVGDQAEGGNVEIGKRTDSSNRNGRNGDTARRRSTDFMQLDESSPHALPSDLDDLPEEEVISRSDSQSSMKYIEFPDDSREEDDSPLKDLQDLPVDDSFSMLHFSQSSNM